MQVCGEHKESKILSYGYFASPFAQDEDLTEIQPNAKGLTGAYACLANNFIMVIIKSKWFSVHILVSNIAFRKESCQTVLS